MSEGRVREFYYSTAWRVWREEFLLDFVEEHGALYCEFCGKCLTDDDGPELHHTPIELSEDNIDDVNITMNRENVVLICHKCHNKAHGRYNGYTYRRKTKKVYLVYGPPLSGKTSYVIEHMQPGDLVVDMDKIYQAISLQGLYDKPDCLASVVKTVRNDLIDQIAKRKGGWTTAWIVGGYPSSVRRDQLLQKTGAEAVFIDAPKELCVKRLDRCMDFRRRHKAEWKGYIDEWYEMHDM